MVIGHGRRVIVTLFPLRAVCCWPHLPALPTGFPKGVAVVRLSLFCAAHDDCGSLGQLRLRRGAKEALSA